MALPPGFRFHPTDVELIMYYLKRKVMGKKLRLEAIAEVNIYNFSPWDLPDKSCLGSKDLEWFFFCPREKKYASGTRVKRATENGYWKTTGKDRSISYNDKIAGTVKTLVFHLGHPPKGERTDWVIHEYKILDDALAAAGVQDTYVLCKVFKKNGLGPKNGAQYGAPFNEADWADDDVDDALGVATSVAPTSLSLMALLPENQSSLRGGSFVPEITQAVSLTEKGPDTNRSFNAMGLFDPGTISGQSPIEGGPNGHCSFVPSGFFDTGNTSGPAAIGERETASAMPSKSEVVVDESDDEMVRLLSAFTEDDMSILNQIVDNDNPKANHVGKRKGSPMPCLDGYDVFKDLGDLNCQRNEVKPVFSGMQIDGFPLNHVDTQENFGFIELNDLQFPLDCPIEPVGTHQSGEVFGSYSEGSMQDFGFAGGLNHIADYTWDSQLPVLPGGYDQGNSSFDMLQRVSDQLPQVSDKVYDLEFANGLTGNWKNGGHHINQDMERDAASLVRGCIDTLFIYLGLQKSKYIERMMESILSCSPTAAKHVALLFSSLVGSSIHIKAEVTYDAGEYTKEALSVMMGESSSCWWNMPLADFQAMCLWFILQIMVYSSDYGFHTYYYCHIYPSGTVFTFWSSCHLNWCCENSCLKYSSISMHKSVTRVFFLALSGFGSSFILKIKPVQPVTWGSDFIFTFIKDIFVSTSYFPSWVSDL